MEYKKRAVWGELETRVLFSIIRDKKILNMLDRKRYRNAHIYKIVEEEMKMRGFTKSATQIRIKWKLLKSVYYKVQRNNGDRRECPFYSELDELLSSRPIGTIAGENGVDTSSVSDHDEGLGLSTSLLCDPLLIEMEEARSTHSTESQDILEETGSSTSSPTPSISDNISATSTSKKRTDKNMYSDALKKFTTDWKIVQEELQNNFLNKQKEMLEEENRKQREWEAEVFRQDRESNEQMMSNIMNMFFANLHSVMRPPLPSYDADPINVTSYKQPTVLSPHMSNLQYNTSNNSKIPPVSEEIMTREEENKYKPIKM